jgi:FAD/FMN-containing dehydrogenase
MNQVVVSDDQKIVQIGAGNRWGNVYPTLDDLGLTMIGGRVSGVGAGGLITGGKEIRVHICKVVDLTLLSGGISFFSGQYGFACDNIQAFEVVLANGTITTASSSRNPTLFRALKGGTNNFAIVTRFDAKLYPQDKFWVGTLAHPATNKDAVIEYISNFTDSETYDPNSALLSNFAWVAGVPTIVHQVAYTDGSAAWPPPAFAEIDAMPKLATTVRKDKLTNFANEIQATQALTIGRNNLLTTLTFVNKDGVTQEFMSEVYDLADATAKELLTVVGLVFTMTFQPLPYTIYSKSAATGGNVLGLDRFTDDFINLLFTLSWQLPVDNMRVETTMQGLEDQIAALAREKGIFNEFVYLNYAAQWQDPIGSYGDANVEFMRSVSRRYDPNGLFQRAVPGGFKLGI